MFIRRQVRRISQLTDTHGRVHNYLRISLTERCNLRCRYCMPPEGVDLSPQNQLLTADEIQQISSILVKKRNLSKIRLTGGEPLIRKDLLDIISGFNELRQYGLSQIGITTNGVALTSKRANRLKSAGLDTANISLDTLEPMKAEFITRRPMEYHKAVLASIDHSLAAGITTKVNCVLQKNLNEDEIIDLVRLGEHRPISVRFIEFMPFSGNEWKNGSRFVSMRDILRRVTDEFGDTLSYLPKEKSYIARNYQIAGFQGTFGIIGSMSQPFCSGCSRIRLTADGTLKTCLFSDMTDDYNLKDFIRSNNPTDDEIIEFISDALQRKKKSHGGMDFLAKNRTNNRAMITIGG